MENKLQRNQHDKMIAGVASGLADYLNTDPAWVRLAFVLAVFAGLSGLLIYIILWVAIPVKPYPPSFPHVDYRVDKTEGAYAPRYTQEKPGNSKLVAGLILIFMGAYFLSNNFHILPYWFSLHKLWPLALIIPGILILSKASKKDHDFDQPDVPKQEIPEDPKDKDQTA